MVHCANLISLRRRLILPAIDLVLLVNSLAEIALALSFAQSLGSSHCGQLSRDKSAEFAPWFHSRSGFIDCTGAEQRKWYRG
jgi:hypothetical protein